MHYSRQRTQHVASSGKLHGMAKSVSGAKLGINKVKRIKYKINLFF